MGILGGVPGNGPAIVRAGRTLLGFDGLPIRPYVGAAAAELSVERLAFSETLSRDYPHGQQVHQPAAATH